MTLIALGLTRVQAESMKESSDKICDQESSSRKACLKQFQLEINNPDSRVVFLTSWGGDYSPYVAAARDIGLKTVYLLNENATNVRAGYDVMFVVKTYAELLECLNREAVPEVRMDKEPLFISIEVPAEFKTTLHEVVSATGINFEGTKEYNGHVTLMHSNNLNSDTQPLWDRLKTMIGTEVRVQILALKFSLPEKMAVFKVKLDDDDIIVQSKIPHITSVLPKTKQPMYSLHLLRENLLPETTDLDLSFTGKIK